MVNVIVKYKDTLNLSGSFRRPPPPQGSILNSYRRVNAESMLIPASELSALQDDPDVEYVEEDHMQYRSSETVGYGVQAIQADSVRIPTPEPSADCFNICVIDSGLLLSHPDIPYSIEQGNVRGAEFGLRSDELWFSPLDDHGSHITGIIIAEGGNDEGVTGVIPQNDGICLLIARTFGDVDGGALGSDVNSAIEWCGDQGARVINMSLGGVFFSQTQASIIQSLRSEGVLVVAAAGNDGSDNLHFPASYIDAISVGAVDSDLEVAGFSQFNERVDFVAPGVEILSTVPSTKVEDSATGEQYDSLLMNGSIILRSVLSGSLVDCGLALETCVGVSGGICLVERGEATFAVKATSCEDGGGTGIIIYNSAGNDGAITSGTLGGVSIGIPVVAIARDSGLKLLLTQAVSLVGTGAGYRRASGTSQAAPHVTGVVARIWAARPECTATQIREAVEVTALDLGPEGRDDQYGEGLVQVEAAYLYLLEQDTPCGTAGATEQVALVGAPSAAGILFSAEMDDQPLTTDLENATVGTPDNSASSRVSTIGLVATSVLAAILLTLG